MTRPAGGGDVLASGHDTRVALGVARAALTAGGSVPRSYHQPRAAALILD